MIFVFLLPSFPPPHCSVYTSCMQRQTCREGKFSFKVFFNRTPPLLQDMTEVDRPHWLSGMIFVSVLALLLDRSSAAFSIKVQWKPLILLPALLITEWEMTKSICLVVARSFPLALLRELQSECNSVVVGCLDSQKSSPDCLARLPLTP